MENFKRLYEWNIPSPSGNAHWDTSVIAKILANEKYIGRLVQGKQKTNNYLEKKILRNISRNDMYITNNHHEAIVDKEIFYAVQQLRQSKVKMEKEIEDIRCLVKSFVQCVENHMPE